MADKRIKVIVPIPMDAAGVANRRSQLSDRIIAPGFAADFVAVPWGAALGDSYHDMLLMDWTVFQAGIDAEEAGYCAVVVDTVSDSGVRALRSRLTIPVVGPGEAAFHTAMLLGKRFTVLTMWPQWFPLYEKTLTDYGLWDRVASLRSIDTRPDVTELLAGKEEAIFAALEAEARAAIERTMLHHDFTCTVDEAHGRIAASFEAVLTGHDGSVTRLNNTNFWRVRDGRFQEVHVYMSGANVLV